MASDPSSSILIRTATRADAAGIAKVHVDTWRTTYAQIVDPGFLARLTYANRTQNALLKLDQPKLRAFVAVESQTGEIVGFADVGPCREKKMPAEGELYAIYLLEAYQGIGLGQRLFEQCVRTLKTEGYKSFFVSVFTENKSSVAFYEKMGGRHIEKDCVVIEGVTHSTDTLVWNLN